MVTPSKKLLTVIWLISNNFMIICWYIVFISQTDTIIFPIFVPFMCIILFFVKIQTNYYSVKFFLNQKVCVQLFLNAFFFEKQSIQLTASLLELFYQVGLKVIPSSSLTLGTVALVSFCDNGLRHKTERSFESFIFSKGCSLFTKWFESTGGTQQDLTLFLS